MLEMMTIYNRDGQQREPKPDRQGKNNCSKKEINMLYDQDRNEANLIVEIKF